MRLTLRTLLAYLDGILDPNDRGDIGKKIEESDYATQLVHRTRDVMRRLRLGAPEPIGSGMGHDPNSVAEYLDNTLDPEHIPDFEKVCLESDVYLAEVGACHNVLTMVLGEPAQIEPASRERMYRLVEGTAMKVDLEAGGVQPPPPPVAEKSPTPATVGNTLARESVAPLRDKLEIPAYLRPPPRSRWWSTVAIVLLVALLMGSLLMVLGPWGPEHPVARALGLYPEVPNEVVAGNDNDGNGGRDAPGPDDVAPAPKDISPTPADGDAQDTPAPKDGADPDRDADKVKVPDADVDPDTKPPIVPPAKPEPNGVPTKAPPVEPPGKDVKPPAGEPNKDAVPPAGDPKKPKGDAEPGDTSADGTKKKPSSTADASPATVGRLLSPEQVLLRFDAAKGLWRRLPVRAALGVGDKLLALPTFRPMISVGAVTLELDDGTLIELEKIDTEGVPKVIVHYGRLIVRTLGLENARLRLVAGSHEGTVTFGDAESTLAVEVRPFRPPGTDPETVPPVVAVDLYAASGRIVWHEGDAPRSVEAISRIRLTPHPRDTTPAADKLPYWVSASDMTPLQRRASPRMAQAIGGDRSVKLTLVEQAEHRLTEIRNLALRSCAHVDHFEPLVVALTDEERRTGWPLFVRELRDAVARDAATAAAVLAAFERRRGERAPELFRMLQGYSAKGLEEKDARILVEYLSHEDLDVRVMASWNLADITGLGLNYHPEYSEVKRRPSIIRWRRRLTQKQIVPDKPAAAAAKDKKIP